MLVVGVFHPSLALGQAAGSWEHLAGRGGAWSGRGGRAPLQQPMGRGGGGCGAQAGGTLGGTDATHFNLRPRERAAAKLQASRSAPGLFPALEAASPPNPGRLR